MYVLGPSEASNIPLCINVMRDNLTQKHDRILEVRREFALGYIPTNAFLFPCSSAHDIPGSPFCYWVTPSALKVFAHWPSLEASLGTAKQGLATTDDFRFLSTSEVVSLTRLAVRLRMCSRVKGGCPIPKAENLHLIPQIIICMLIGKVTGEKSSLP